MTRGQTRSRRSLLVKSGLGLLALSPLAVGAYVIFISEEITVIAINRCQVGVYDNGLLSSWRVIDALEPGQSANVLYCKGIKSDIEIHIALASGVTGVLDWCDFRLQRKHASLKAFLSGSAVQSCDGQFIDKAEP